VAGEADVDGVARIVEHYAGGPDNAGNLAQMVVSRGKSVFIRFRAERHITWDLRQG